MAQWLIVGDPHGNYAPLRDALATGPEPDAVILLGDMDLERPLEIELRDCDLDPLRTPVFWIPGNHDAEAEAYHDNLFHSALADRNLHGKVVEIDGLRVAGLGGVFRGKVWNGIDAPRHASRSAFLRQVVKSQRWREGIPLRHVATIWPEDVDALTAACANAPADILITHEAPSFFPTGHAGIDRAARLSGARAVLHGHHHAAYRGCALDGTRVHGFAEAEARWIDPTRDLFA